MRCILPAEEGQQEGSDMAAAKPKLTYLVEPGPRVVMKR